MTSPDELVVMGSIVTEVEFQGTGSGENPLKGSSPRFVRRRLEPRPPQDCIAYLVWPLGRFGNLLMISYFEPLPPVVGGCS